MKLNKRGFTLIELIAMLVVLGILMAVTVPNITGILSQSKTNVLKEAANKMVDTAKVKIASNSKIKKPTQDNCLIFTLDYLDDNDEFKKGPNDGEYDKFDSFVIVKRENNTYKYYVRLIEIVENNGYGIENADYDMFQNNPDEYIGKVELRYRGSTSTIATNKENLKKHEIVTKNNCTKVDVVY